MQKARGYIVILTAVMLLLTCTSCWSATPEPETPEGPTEGYVSGGEAGGGYVDMPGTAATQPPNTEIQTDEPTEPTAPETEPTDTEQPDTEQPTETTEPATEPGSTETTEPTGPTEPTTETGTTTPPEEPVTTLPPDDGPVVLTIRGDGVNSETTWSLARLLSLGEGYRENTYSTTNNWPVFGHMVARGLSLQYLLRQAGMRNNAASFKLIATDGYSVTVTYEQIFGTRFTFASHSASGSGGVSTVEPVIAWEWGEAGKVRAEKLRSFFGHRGPMEVNTSSFVQDLCIIEVSTTSAGVWAAPDVSIPDGDIVPSGTELHFLHPQMDSTRIYYTLDGSEPNFSSPVYNRSTSYFQPHLIVPILLTESLTIKAFAAGYGRGDSPVVTFNISVS